MLNQHKLVIIPGTQMKFSKFFSRFAPDKLIMKVAYRFQKKKIR